MDFNWIKEQLANGTSYVELAKQFSIPKSTLISRCIKAGIRSRDVVKKLNNKNCSKCNTVKDNTEFYIRKNGNLDSYCKACVNKVSKERKHDIKKQCLEYKGNKCEICGYNKCIGALHFHHLSPSEKDFAISNLRSYTINDKIKKELDKCQILCANCHSEKHYYLSE